MTMDFDPFDKNVPVPLDYDLPLDFAPLADAWRSGPDERRRAAARHLENAVHAADIRRAAKPPEISVTLQGVPGTISTRPGSGTVAWKVSPPGALCTSRCTAPRPVTSR